MRRDAGFVQGQHVIAFVTLVFAIGFAIWLKGGALVILAGVAWGVGLYVLSFVWAGRRVHVELGCLVALLALGILSGAAVWAVREGFDGIAALSIACGTLTAALVVTGLALRAYDR